MLGGQGQRHHTTLHSHLNGHSAADYTAEAHQRAQFVAEKEPPGMHAHHRRNDLCGSEGQAAREHGRAGRERRGGEGGGGQHRQARHHPNKVVLDSAWHNLRQKGARNHREQHNLQHIRGEAGSLHGHVRPGQARDQNRRHHRRQQRGAAREHHREGDVALGHVRDHVGRRAARAARHQNQPNRHRGRQVGQPRHRKPHKGHDCILQRDSGDDSAWPGHGVRKVLAGQREAHGHHDEEQAHGVSIPRHGAEDRWFGQRHRGAAHDPQPIEGGEEVADSLHHVQN
mmetsp:Transcript_29452/g.56572  ORF Transcript_29452/g.56572 Transcript_29452/m.56572 type:complete len:284 (-) Transcript_29452:500-1351(-)